MARYMTQQEKAEFHADFPQMNVQSTLVTGEATPVGGPLPLYNCIAHSVGIIDDWFNLAPTVASFEYFYKALGYVPGFNKQQGITVSFWGAEQAGRRDGHGACLHHRPFS